MNNWCFWLVVSKFGRRNLPIFVRAELALKAKPLLAERAKKEGYENRGKSEVSLQNSANIRPADTRQSLAKKAEVSHDTIAKTEKILAKANEEAKAELRGSVFHDPLTIAH
jgi:hypothetical protein